MPKGTGSLKPSGRMANGEGPTGFRYYAILSGRSSPIEAAMVKDSHRRSRRGAHEVVPDPDGRTLMRRCEADDWARKLNEWFQREQLQSTKPQKPKRGKKK